MKKKSKNIPLPNDIDKVARKKILKGVVVSAKMEKTAVVVAKRLVAHPKYKKRYWVSKRYKAHNPGNTHKEGEEVVIRESRPLSKDKRWVIVNPKSNPPAGGQNSKV